MKKILRVACGIISKNGLYLIVQRAENTKKALQWEFPGGKVEADETDEACILRELKEELDIEVKVNRQLKSIFQEDADFIIELIPFCCEHIGGEITLLEHLQLAWIDLEQPIIQQLCQGDYGIIEQLIRK